MDDREFNSLPIRVMLDTAVIQNILTFGELIYEHALSKALESKFLSLPVYIQNDIHSLSYVLEHIERTPITPIISELSLYELSMTGDKNKCRQLLQWGFDLLQYRETIDGLISPVVSPNQTIIGDFLTGRIDRLLLGESKRVNCQAFITMDYKTILKHKKRLCREEHITVLSPSEWWTILRPWFPLWV